jgi:hypothetical protein
MFALEMFALEMFALSAMRLIDAPLKPNVTHSFLVALRMNVLLFL